MSFSDLISLENQLNDSLHSVKDQKVKRAYNNLYSKRLIPDLKSFVLISDSNPAQSGRKIPVKGNNKQG